MALTRLRWALITCSCWFCCLAIRCHTPTQSCILSCRQACFGGDDDEYDQEAGGKGESELKYRKVYMCLVLQSGSCSLMQTLHISFCLEQLQCCGETRAKCRDVTSYVSACDFWCIHGCETYLQLIAMLRMDCQVYLQLTAALTTNRFARA